MRKEISGMVQKSTKGTKTTPKPKANAKAAKPTAKKK
jgi:hypothetical protein